MNAHSAAAAPATPAAIMVCLDDSRGCASALDRASDLARLRGAGLHVLASLTADDGRSDRRRRRRRLSDSLHEASAVLVKPSRLTGETRVGSLAQTAIEAGTELCPSLVVIGDIPGAGRSAVLIADALGVAVLVARRRTHSDRLLIATDLRRTSRPMIAAGHRYAWPRTVAITVLHVATPPDPDAAPRFLPLREVESSTLDRAGTDRYAQLREIGQDHPDLGLVLGTCRDPGAGILAFANQTAADVIAIGYAQRATFGSRPRRTTEQLVDRTRCSVLVVPLARELEID